MAKVETTEWVEWTDKVTSWQDMTKDVPRLVRDDIAKGRMKTEDPARGIKALMHDPLSVQYAMGYKDRKYSLTFDVLKRIPHQLSVVGAIINTRVNQVAAFSVPFRTSKSVGFVVKHKDPSHLTSKSEQKFIQELEKFIYNCGHLERNPHNTKKRDDFETFLKKIVRDSITFDQACFELVPDRRGQPFEFVAVDASTIRIAASNSVFGPNDTYQARSPAYSGRLLQHMIANERGPYRSMQLYGQDSNTAPAFVQIINGQIENVYTEGELAFGVRNPRTDIYVQGYGYGEIEQLITIITSHLYAEEYNRRFFMQGSAPKGILNFRGDAMTPDMLEGFRRQWRASLESVENCVSGDTRIYTKESGFASLADICGDKEEVPVHLWIGTSWETGLVYKAREPKVLCRTTLDNGVVLETSPDHKIRVIGESGDPEWCTQAELSEGRVVLVNATDTSADTELCFKGTPVSEDLLEVLGWFLGDGSSSPRTNVHGDLSGSLLCWHYNAESEQDILKKHLHTLQQYFPEAYHYSCERSDEEISSIERNYGLGSVQRTVEKIMLQKKEATQWFVSHGFLTKDGAKKTIPAQLFTMSSHAKGAYLRGFAAAAGSCAKGRSPILHVADTQTREDLKQLLLSVGIRTCLSEGKTKIQIRGRERTYVEAKSCLRIKDRDQFFNKVGFLQDHKQPVALTKPHESNNLDRVPRATIQRYLTQVREANKESGYTLLTRRERMDLNSILSGADGCSRPRMLCFMKKCAVPVPNWLTAYHTARVVKTENTGILIPMFDVSVNHVDHMFIGDGVLLSNSWRTPILQAEAGLEWIDLHPSNRDMEYGSWLEYLIKVSCAIFLVDPAELNFDMHGGVQQTPLFESSQEWKLKASRDRGLKPLLRFVAKLINENIISKIDDHFVFDFVGLDELTEQEKHTLRTEQVSSYLTLNEVRRSDDLDDLEYGDMPMNPTYLQAMQIKMQMEQQKQLMEQQQQQQAAGGATAGAEGAPEGGPPAQEEPAPEYAERFQKSVKVDNGVKFLEISLDDWIGAVRGDDGSQTD